MSIPFLLELGTAKPQLGGEGNTDARPSLGALSWEIGLVAEPPAPCIGGWTKAGEEGVIRWLPGKQSWAGAGWWV